MEKFHLFCLPFAGGNKYCYRKLEKVAEPFIEVITLEYPGRGTRISEQLLTDIDALTDDLYKQMKDMLYGRYAIYGHSMGGLLACLLSRKLIGNGHPPAAHLFITGTAGPSGRKDNNKWHLLEKGKFLEKIKDMQGSPDEVLCNEEILDYFEPILRADFKASESYIYDGSYPQDIPFTVITGTEEDMEKEQILSWRKESLASVDFKRLPGKHFFIFDYPEKIMEIIARKLSISY